MAHFVETTNGYVNADEISWTDGKTIMLKSGKTFELKEHASMTVAQVLPADGKMFAVVVENAATASVNFEPVLAWAVMMTGDIAPITPTSPFGVWERLPPLMRDGTKGVYDFTDGVYSTYEEFLKVLIKGATKG
ncbi:MAG: hypothetical protein KF765_12145 [Parvibaculaceae bacterium]|nr:hypothetical protein [Parvibaculaceae bacterium]